MQHTILRCADLTIVAAMFVGTAGAVALGSPHSDGVPTHVLPAAHLS